MTELHFDPTPYADAIDEYVQAEVRRRLEAKSGQQLYKFEFDIQKVNKSNCEPLLDLIMDFLFDEEK